MNIISFCVKVPVLSVNRYYILPNSSGIWEFLTTAPSISLSLFINLEKYIFARSRLSLIEIGIIAHSKMTHLKYLMYQVPTKPSTAIIRRAKKHMVKNRIFAKRFTSKSNLPNLDRGFFPFKLDLVSLPVYNTSPYVSP